MFISRITPRLDACFPLSLVFAAFAWTLSSSASAARFRRPLMQLVTGRVGSSARTLSATVLFHLSPASTGVEQRPRGRVVRAADGVEARLLEDAHPAGPGVPERRRTQHAVVGADAGSAQHVVFTVDGQPVDRHAEVADAEACCGFVRLVSLTVTCVGRTDHDPGLMEVRVCR